MTAKINTGQVYCIELKGLHLQCKYWNYSIFYFKIKQCKIKYSTFKTYFKNSKFNVKLDKLLNKNINNPMKMWIIFELLLLKNTYLLK